MNKEIKEKWVTALRSGEYKQGQYALSRETSEGITNCCLGVLCRIAVGDEIIPPPIQDDDGVNPKDFHFLGQIAYLPQIVQEWAGMPGDNRGKLFKPIKKEEKTTIGTLSGLNDHGYTFEQIAQVIEEQF